jgi:hypothetical protein
MNINQRKITWEITYLEFFKLSIKFINFEHIMGKHGVGTMNENGNLFVELCGNHSLKIGGTLFPHKKCHKNTWYSNDHVTTAQLDNVCISSRWSKALL